MARRSFGVLALVAVSIGTAIAATPTAVQPTQLGASSASEDDIGALPSIDQIVAIQSQIAADGAAADPTGVAGAGGGTLAYHAGGKAANGKGSARLYRTGFLGLEPTFGIDSRGTLFANAAAASDATFSGLVIRSRDGGASWQDVSSRVAGVDTHSYTEDPYLYVDPVTDRVFWNDLQEPCQLISTSDDEGVTWADNLTACDQSDHQSMAAGPAPTGGAQPAGYPNVVYDCAINAGVAVPASNATTCDKSLDGGATFAFTGAPAFVGGPPSDNNSSIPGTCDGAAAHAFVGPDGTLYLPRGWCGQPYLAISHDEGASWTRVQVANNGMNLGADPIGDIPASDHEAGVAADSLGNVYYAWVAYNRQPYLAISHDGGATWGKPIPIGPPGLRQAVLPSLALGSSGNLAFAYGEHERPCRTAVSY